MDLLLQSCVSLQISPEIQSKKLGLLSEKHYSIIAAVRKDQPARNNYSKNWNSNRSKNNKKYDNQNFVNDNSCSKSNHIQGLQATSRLRRSQNSKGLPISKRKNSAWAEHTFSEEKKAITQQFVLQNAKCLNMVSHMKEYNLIIISLV